jgi:hypothetical protein
MPGAAIARWGKGFMFNRYLLVISAFVLLNLPALVAAKNLARVERVSFSDGRATVKGRIRGYQSVDYVFPAGAGESMRLSLKTNRLSNYFNVLAPGAEAAMFIGSVSGTDFAGTAPTAGDYTARVYLMRSAARRGTVANYTLAIALGEKSATDAKGPDYADGLTGGPDYWKVVGVADGERFSLRDRPADAATRVADLARGAVLKNLGCRNTRGQTWCEAEDQTRKHGWVKGRYLRESAPPQ